MPFAAALSTVPSTSRALDEVCSTATLGHQPDLACVFFSAHHGDDATLIARTLIDRVQPKILLGCIGEAVVGVGREVERSPGLSLWLGSWNGNLALEAFHLLPRKTPDGLSLLGWPDSLVDGDTPTATALILGDPFTFPAMESFLPQVNNDYGGLRVTGGMASGMPGPGQTPLIYGSEVHSVGAVGVLMRGPSQPRSIVSQGCRPVGNPLVITKGHDNIIVELGGRTPLDQLRSLYSELPARDQALFQRGPHVGLVTNEYQETFRRGDFLVRNLHAVDRETGAMAVTDHIRVGQTIQFHVRDAETADEDLRELLRADRQLQKSSTAGAMLFTCNGRGTRLFGSPDHDAATLKDELGTIPVAGFFAAGEFGPVGGKNFIHGFTASVVLFED